VVTPPPTRQEMPPGTRPISVEMHSLTQSAPLGGQHRADVRRATQLPCFEGGYTAPRVGGVGASGMRHSVSHMPITSMGSGAKAEYMRQSLIRDDGPEEDQLAAQPSLSFVRKTTKYWVRSDDMAEVKRIVGQNLPEFQFNKELDDDAQLCNSVYLDNAQRELYTGRLLKSAEALAIRLRWYDFGDPETVFVERKTHQAHWGGEVSVKERFPLHADDVVPFLRGEYTVEHAEAAMREQGQDDTAIESMRTLFTEIYDVIASRKIEPAVRTQYMRAAWQSDSNASVRISLDHNLCMIAENPTQTKLNTLQSNRWFRDPLVPMLPNEVTWFPHAVLEVKLALPEGEVAPEWVENLLDTNLVHEVNKFSKFLHGTATLMPLEVNAAPYCGSFSPSSALFFCSALQP
jgi:SPX domain protein involved in polyphosphate accumulation